MLPRKISYRRWKIVKAEPSDHVSPDQQVREVHGQGRLVPVLRFHQVSNLIVDADAIATL